MRRHPSRERLQRWLDTGETKRVDRHVSECDQCQQTLETVTALDDEVVAELQTAITPPDDLQTRTNVGVDGRLRSEAAAGAFADLFMIGWDVIHTILDPTTDSDGAHAAVEETDGSLR